MVYYALVRPEGLDAIFENRQLEIKENCNSYDEIGWTSSIPKRGKKFLAKRIRAHDGCLGIGRL